MPARAIEIETVHNLQQWDRWFLRNDVGALIHRIASIYIPRFTRAPHAGARGRKSRKKERKTELDIAANISDETSARNSAYINSGEPAHN